MLLLCPSRQEKEAWIKSKYVEKRFLKKMSGSEALVEGERKSRPWTVKKCHRHNSSVRAPNKARRKYHRYEPGSASPANLSAGQCNAVAFVCGRILNLRLNWNVVIFCSRQQPQQSFAGTRCSVQMSWTLFSRTLTPALVLAVSPLHIMSKHSCVVHVMVCMSSRVHAV